MDSIERLKYQIAFGFLAPSIEGQRKMDSSYRAHIETAKGLLKEVVGELETIASQEGEFHPVENFREIFGLSGFDASKPLSREQAESMAEYFRDRVKLFEKLIEDPEAVYEKFPHRARLLILCEDFRKFYADNHQVLGEMKEAVEDEYFLPVHGKDDGTAD